MQSPSRSACARTRVLMRPKQKSRYKPPPRVKVEVYGRRKVGWDGSSGIHSENTSGKLRASIHTKIPLVCIVVENAAGTPATIQTQKVPPQFSSGKASSDSKATGSTCSSIEGTENSLCNVVRGKDIENEEWLAVHPDLKGLTPQVKERKSVSQQEANPPFPPSVETINHLNNPAPVQDNLIPNFTDQPMKKISQEPMNPMFTVLPRGPAPPGKGPWNKNFQQFVPVQSMLPPASAPFNGALEKESHRRKEIPAPIFVGNLGPDVDEVNLSTLFLQVGPIKDATVPWHQKDLASLPTTTLHMLKLPLKHLAVRVSTESFKEK
ncbi:hypothetical protein BSKO_04704 [Bryopsis sp. KO-2023]|nr:hypothetical protein BSKO_04704 [Bryopsis sp. KO-2023]